MCTRMYESCTHMYMYTHAQKLNFRLAEYNYNPRIHEAKAADCSEFKASLDCRVRSNQPELNSSRQAASEPDNSDHSLISKVLPYIIIPEHQHPFPGEGVPRVLRLTSQLQ